MKLSKITSSMLGLGFSLLFASQVQAQCDSTYLSEALKAGQWVGDIAWSFVPISEAQEEEIGEQMHSQMQQNFQLITQGKQYEMLQRILRRLTPFVERKDIKYQIHLIQDDDLINAFSIAGGHLYMTTGILKWAQSEDEVAFIVGHEIGHVDEGHCIEHVKRNVTIQMIADYLEMGEYAPLMERTQAVLGTPFGQIDEYTSDRKGAYLAWKAGYDPNKGKDFFDRLAAMEAQQQGNRDIEIFFRTHPFSDQRKTCLDYYIHNEMH